MLKVRNAQYLVLQCYKSLKALGFHQNCRKFWVLVLCDGEEWHDHRPFKPFIVNDLKFWNTVELSEFINVITVVTCSRRLAWEVGNPAGRIVRHLE